MATELSLFGDAARYSGGLREVGPGIHAWLQPNGAWGESNAGLVVGEGESLLVDTLWDLPLTRRMLRAIEPIARQAPIRTLVNTHSDGDHFWGNQLLDDVEIVSSEASAHAMRELAPGTLTALARVGAALGLASRSPIPFPGRLALRGVGRGFAGMTGPFDFSGIERTYPSRTFRGELSLQVGGRAVRLIEVGPAHTAGDVLVHVPDAKLLFAGDILFLGSTPVMWAGPVSNWIAALDRILELDLDTVVPGHGPVTGKDGVQELRRHWRFVESAARVRHGLGMSAADSARDILRDEGYRWLDWDCPERLAINVNALYRRYEGKSGEVGAPERVRVLARSGVLGGELPGAAPASIHPGR